MASGKAAGFRPPSADQVVRLFEQHAATGPSPNLLRLLLVALVAVVVLAFFVSHPAFHVLPWLLLLGLIGFAVFRVRSLQRLEQRVGQAQELATMRYYRQALRLIWRLIPRLIHYPELQARAVGVMAFTLDQTRSYDAATVAYDHLIERVPPEHPAALQLRLQRAILRLLRDHLADADDDLRRLRSVPEDFPGSPLSATYHLALLSQQVRTNHFEDAIERADTLVDDLRPLGMEAASGYALLALAFHHLVRRREDELEREHLCQQAQLWWSRAAMLLPPAALIARFPELAPLDAEYASVDGQPQLDDPDQDQPSNQPA